MGKFLHVAAACATVCVVYSVLLKAVVGDSRCVCVTYHYEMLGLRLLGAWCFDWLSRWFSRCAGGGALGEKDFAAAIGANDQPLAGKAQVTATIGTLLLTHQQNGRAHV